MRSRGNAVVGIVASFALAACHGDDTNTSTTAAPPATVASSVGKTFTGTVSFGDTVVIQLDKPSTGQATVTFPHSQYGLTGTYVQPYSWTTSTGTTAAVAVPVQSGMGVLSSAMKKIVGAGQALAATFVPSAFAQTAPPVTPQLPPRPGLLGVPASPDCLSVRWPLSAQGLSRSPRSLLWRRARPRHSYSPERCPSMAPSETC